MLWKKVLREDIAITKSIKCSLKRTAASTIFLWEQVCLLKNWVILLILFKKVELKYIIRQYIFLNNLTSTDRNVNYMLVKVRLQILTLLWAKPMANFGSKWNKRMMAILNILELTNECPGDTIFVLKYTFIPNIDWRQPVKFEITFCHSVHRDARVCSISQTMSSWYSYCLLNKRFLYLIRSMA